MDNSVSGRKLRHLQRIKLEYYLLREQLATTESGGLLRERVNWKFIDIDEEVSYQSNVASLAIGLDHGSENIGLITLNTGFRSAENFYIRKMILPTALMVFWIQLCALLKPLASIPSSNPCGSCCKM
jgi:hypothetical protein